MQRGTWLVERCFSDKPKVVTSHSGMSYVCLLIPVVRHSPPHAGARALGKGRLTIVLFDAELLTVLWKISHIFFVRGDSGPNVNSRPFHWSRDFCRRSHSAEKHVRPSRVCILKTKVSVSSGKDWLLTLCGPGVHEDVFYVYKYIPNCFRCAEVFYFPGSTGTGAVDPTTHFSWAT